MKIRKFVKAVADSLKRNPEIWNASKTSRVDTGKTYSLIYRPNDSISVSVKELKERGNIVIEGFSLNKNEFKLIKPLFYQLVKNVDKDYAKTQTFLKNRHQRIIIQNLTKPSPF